MQNIIKDTQISIDNRIFTCCGVWFRGNKKMKYEFYEDKFPDEVFTRDCDKIDLLVKQGKIVKL